MASSQCTFTSQSQRHVYSWRTFCIEFLYGVVVVLWYLLALAEMTVFKGLSGLEKSTAPASPDVLPHHDSIDAATH